MTTTQNPQFRLQTRSEIIETKISIRELRVQHAKGAHRVREQEALDRLKAQRTQS